MDEDDYRCASKVTLSPMTKSEQGPQNPNSPIKTTVHMVYARDVDSLTSMSSRNARNKNGAALREYLVRVARPKLSPIQCASYYANRAPYCR